jgi:hypothetical protein
MREHIKLLEQTAKLFTEAHKHPAANKMAAELSRWTQALAKLIASTSASSLRTSRRLSYCGDRTGGPVSAWGPFGFYNCIARMQWRPHAWCPGRSSDQCSIRLIKNRQSGASSANRFSDRIWFSSRDRMAILGHFRRSSARATVGSASLMLLLSPRRKTKDLQIWRLQVFVR